MLGGTYLGQTYLGGLGSVTSASQNAGVVNLFGNSELSVSADGSLATPSDSVVIPGTSSISVVASKSYVPAAGKTSGKYIISNNQT